jgi:predicted amidohydrolase
LQGVEVILIPTANGYPLGINVLSSVIVPARGLENNAFVAYVNWVQVRINAAGSVYRTPQTRLLFHALHRNVLNTQDDPSFPEFLTFHGQTTVSDTGGNLLYVGPADTAALAHIRLNFTGYNPGSTVYNRPSPDVNGLCGNVTSPSN